MVKIITSKLPKTPNYNITVLGKNNQHKPYLFNDVRELIKGKGVTTNFHIGEEKIIMQASTKKMATILSKGLKRLGIVREPKSK